MSRTYLKAQDTADEYQHNENQTHITQCGNLLFVREIVRLKRKEQSVYLRSIYG